MQSDAVDRKGHGRASSCVCVCGEVSAVYWTEATILANDVECGTGIYAKLSVHNVLVASESKAPEQNNCRDTYVVEHLRSIYKN